MIAYRLKQWVSEPTTNKPMQTSLHFTLGYLQSREYLAFPNSIDVVLTISNSRNVLEKYTIRCKITFTMESFSYCIKLAIAIFLYTWY